MTLIRRLPFAAGLFVLVVSTACTAPPEKELHQAEGALETARAAGAAHYAPEAFGAAEAAMTRANTAVTERDYKQALNHALDAREHALNAVRNAAEARARVRGEIEHQLAGLETQRLALDARITEAETARVGRQPLAAARAVSERVTKALTDVRPLLDEGADDKAMALLQPLSGLLTSTRSEIDAAVVERNSRRPVRRTRR